MSNDAATSPDSANVDELQARLAEREHLVGELTSRLEQAAEQLDRFRRTGASRGHVAGGIPAELIEEQMALTESLQGAVQHWEDMQPGMLLSRLEMQVSEIRDLIVNGGGGVSAPASEPKSLVDHLFSAANSELQTEQKSDEEGSPQEAPPSEESSGLSTYELFKAGLDGGADQPIEMPAPTTEQATPEPIDEPEIPEDFAEEESVAETPTVDPPDDVDFATATEDDLRSAIDERDSYITYLLRKLRMAETAVQYSGNWSELENVPDELRTRLEEYEARLEESLRRAEIETSMERARLGREANRLELWEEQLNKKAAQLGMSKNEDAAADGEALTPQKTSLAAKCSARNPAAIHETARRFGHRAVRKHVAHLPANELPSRCYGRLCQRRLLVSFDSATIFVESASTRNVVDCNATAFGRIRVASISTQVEPFAGIAGTRTVFIRPTGVPLMRRTVI